MRLCESDNRTKIDKLKDLVNHPGTGDIERSVAMQKLNLLLQQQPQSFSSPSTSRTVSNVGGSHWNSIYIGRMTHKQIFDILCNLIPSPSEIFFRPGKIVLLIPPPYHGLSKQQYFSMIRQQFPYVKTFESKFLEDKGYVIELLLF